MERTCLRNTNCCKQVSLHKAKKFLCITSKKSKKRNVANLNEKNFTDSRKSWQTVKLFLSEKNKLREKITLVKNEEVISDNVEVANTLNNYFWNVIKNLKIPEKFVTDNLPQSLSRHPTLNAILKYKNHSSMHVIKRFSQRFSSFYFSHMTKMLFLKRLKN